MAPDRGIRVAITQPYVPAYRFPLWDRVIARLADEGVAGRVFFGGDAEQLAIRARRGDGVEAPWAEQVPVTTVAPSRRLPKLQYRRLPGEWAAPALLVTEMQGANLNAWMAAARGRGFVTFGHGKSYTSAEGRASMALENALNRRARHVLTYTDAGRDTVLARTGKPGQKVTAFRNATDTSALRAALAAVGPDEVNAFKSAHGIPAEARIALYLGALNAHKRIDLLAQAAAAVFERDGQWWLVVAGAGDQEPALRELAERTGRVVLLGQAGPADFAPAARDAELLVNPGRVGLVAVDALAMGLPILAADWDLNAPEVEYLEEGRDIVTVKPDADAIAARWLAWNAPAAAAGTAGAERSLPTVEGAADTIAAVILDELGIGAAA